MQQMDRRQLMRMGAKAAYVVPAILAIVKAAERPAYAFVPSAPAAPGPPIATNKEQCKYGGWMTVVRADGSEFKNQGDCIQLLNTGK